MSTLHDFDGPAYNPDIDQDRLAGQYKRIFNTMLDGEWRTYKEIARITGDPQNSISAQLRHMRKPRFGSHTVERRSRGERGDALYEYRLKANSEAVIKPKTQKFHGGNWSREDGSLTVHFYKHKIDKYLTTKEQGFIAKRVRMAILEAEHEIAATRGISIGRLYASEIDNHQ